MGPAIRPTCVVCKLNWVNPRRLKDLWKGISSLATDRSCLCEIFFFFFNHSGSVKYRPYSVYATASFTLNQYISKLEGALIEFKPKPYWCTITLSPTLAFQPKIIHYTKFEHFRIICFWVMLWILVWKCTYWFCDLDLWTPKPCHF